MSFYSASRSILIPVLALFALAPALSASDKGDDFRNEKEAETYYLIRALESLYLQLPNVGVDEDIFKVQMQSLRTSALQLRSRAEYALLDPEVSMRYSDYIKFLDGYVDYLVKIDVIDAEAEDSYLRFKDALDSGIKGGKTTFDVGLKVGTGVATVFPEPGTASTVGALAGGIAGVTESAVSYYRKNKARDRLREIQLERATQHFLDSCTEFTEIARQTAFKLSEKYQWSRGEVGWSRSDPQAEKYFSYLHQGNVEGLKLAGLKILQSRPRDVLAFISHGELLLQAQILDGIDEILFFRNLAENKRKFIPAHATYDDVRLGLDYYVAYLTTLAAVKPHDEQAREIDKAVEKWNSLLERAQGDPTGRIRKNLAYALACQGHGLRGREYSDQVLHLFTSDPTYHYERVLILSEASTELMRDVANATGRALSVFHLRKKNAQMPEIIAEGMRSLDVAAEAGMLNVEALKAESAYEYLHGNEFNKYTTIDIDWHVKEDVLKDDIVLVNESEHSLTNVSISFNLRSDDNQRAEIAVRSDHIAPGERKVWEDELKSKWGSQWVVGKSEIILTCDQNARN